MTFAVTNDFHNGSVADATEVNTNFTDVENEINGVTNTGDIVRKADLEFVLIGSEHITTGSKYSIGVSGTFLNDYKNLKFTGTLVRGGGGNNEHVTMHFNSRYVGSSYDYRAIWEGVYGQTLNGANFRMVNGLFNWVGSPVSFDGTIHLTSNNHKVVLGWIGGGNQIFSSYNFVYKYPEDLHQIEITGSPATLGVGTNINIYAMR